MFESLKKFKLLKDHVQVWPGHGAGSACGKALGAVPSSTVGYEKFVNWALQFDEKNSFVEALLEGQPEPPKYFAMMKKLNKTGPAILGGIPHPARLTLTQFKDAVEENITIVDTRDKFAFAGGHIGGSLNIQDNSTFTTWMGWMLDYNEKFLLIAPEHRIEELTKSLIRIGLDNIYGYFPNLESWANVGHELDVINQITCTNLRKKIDSEKVQVIDVRGASEYKTGAVDNALNIHVGSLPENLDKIRKDIDVVVHCATGDRSSIACSYLKKKGFDNVINLTGGYQHWLQECALEKELVET